MPKPSEIMEQVSNVSTGKEVMKAAETIGQLVARIDVKKRFEEILGKNAAGFMSSILSTTNSSNQLKTCDPKTILSAAMMAATLELPINQNLGFAHLVPYKDKCQFQMGWKGFVQLAMRTAMYKTMNAEVVYEGELKSFNRITGEIEIDLAGKKSDTVIGYVAFFRLLNGFEKYHYLSKEAVEKHAKRYSKSFEKDYSPWKTNFDAMALKTVIKSLLSKYGILSIQMQRAITADQGVILDPGKEAESPSVDFVDTTAAASEEDSGTAQEPDLPIIGSKA